MVWLSPRVANSHQSDAALFVSCAAFYLRQGALSPVAHDGAALHAPAVPHLITARRLQKKSDKASDAQTTKLCNSTTQHISPSVPPI